uniref:Uncharacterized protein n=1 Tax=Anguilla anguilla TaxID=7936 RepID=A0A0E9U4P6_ANGAN
MPTLKMRAVTQQLTSTKSIFKMMIQLMNES